MRLERATLEAEREARLAIRRAAETVPAGDPAVDDWSWDEDAQRAAFEAQRRESLRLGCFLLGAAFLAGVGAGWLARGLVE